MRKLRVQFRVAASLAIKRALEPWLREIIADERRERHVVYGPAERLKIASSARVHDGFFNTMSGTIVVEDWAFFGHGVMVLTGTHDISKTDESRHLAFPTEGRDILIEQGAWIASRAVLVGPCKIGRNAVVGASAIVRGDVPAGCLVPGPEAAAAEAIRGVGPTEDRATRTDLQSNPPTQTSSVRGSN